MAVLPLVSQEVFLAASFLVAQLRVVDLFMLLPHHRRSIINPLQHVEEPECRLVPERYWDGYAYRVRRVQVCD